MGKKQPKSPVEASKAGSATKSAKGKASVKKRPASAIAVRDAAIDEAEQKRSRMQENLWALEKQVLYNLTPELYIARMIIFSPCSVVGVLLYCK